MGMQTGLESFAQGLDPSMVYLVVGALGVAFAYFGLAIYEGLLATIGAIVGGAVGAAAGGVFLPQMVALPEPQLWTRLGAAAVATFVGLKLGASLILLFNRLAVMLAGFSASALAAFVVLVGQNLHNAPAYVRSATVLRSPQVAAQAPLEHPMLLVFLAGLVGAILAWKFYTVIIAFTTSVFGASAVGVAVPILLRGKSVLDPTAVLATVTLPNVWFGIAFVTGFLFQLGLFHFDVVSDDGFDDFDDLGDFDADGAEWDP